MRGWVLVGLITGVIFGGAAALVAWVFAMPLGITVRVVALAFPLGIALEWVAVRGRGVGFPVAFVAIGAFAFLLFQEIRDFTPGPRWAGGPEGASAAPAGVVVEGAPAPSQPNAATRPQTRTPGTGRTRTRTAEPGRTDLEPGRRDLEPDRASPGAESREPATLSIRNPTKGTLRLWIVDSSGRSRLGRLRSGRTREVRVRAREPSVVIEVRNRDGGYALPVGIAPGAMIQVALVSPGATPR